MDAGNGGADVLGLRHERLALVGEVAEQAADAHFVVVVGALDGGHFVVHQRFKFGGAGERAFDAVAHGGDFAADGLADRHHRLARRRLRLRQPQRHRGHGFGDRAHLLRAADELGEHVEGDDRQQDRDGGGDGDQRAHARGGEQRLQFGTEHESGAGDAGHPGDGGDGGEHEGRARGRALVKRLQHLADIGAVVVGRARRGLVGLPGLLRLFHRQFGLRVGRRVGAVAFAWRFDRRGLVAVTVAELERGFYGIEGVSHRVISFLGAVGHFGRRLVCTPDCCSRPASDMTSGRATSAGACGARRLHPKSLSHAAGAFTLSACPFERNQSDQDFPIIVNLLFTIN